MIFHIPHASRDIPDDLRSSFLLRGGELEDELTRMTDAFTDELFAPLARPADTVVRFPVSRLVVDPERFREDKDEPMAKVGMGAIYTQTAHGDPLRRQPQRKTREALLRRYYDPHHERLERAVAAEIARHGSAFILDCHSFPMEALPCDRDQSDSRPDICIGTDAYHTPPGLAEALADAVKKAPAFHSHKWKVAIDAPYSGSIVPSRYYQRDKRIVSVMIEVSRCRYMDEETGKKREWFTDFQMRFTQIVREGLFNFFLRSGVTKLAELDRDARGSSDAPPVELSGRSFWGTIDPLRSAASQLCLGSSVIMNPGWADAIEARRYSSRHQLFTMQDVLLLFDLSEQGVQNAWDRESTEAEVNDLLAHEEHETVRQATYLEALGVKTGVSEEENLQILERLREELRMAGDDHLMSLVRVKEELASLRLTDGRGGVDSDALHQLDMTMVGLIGSVQTIFCGFERWVNQLLTNDAELWPYRATRDRLSAGATRGLAEDPLALEQYHNDLVSALKKLVKDESGLTYPQYLQRTIDEVGTPDDVEDRAKFECVPSFRAWLRRERGITAKSLSVRSR